jgi:D-lactate dehydrogenase (cytochrome)
MALMSRRSSRCLSVADKLRKVLPEAVTVSVGDSILDLHSRDLGPYRHRPDVVVFARRPEDVAATVNFAAAEVVPVVPYGAGTSNGGLAIPIKGGISLDLNGMDDILDISPRDFTATVRPGVTRKRLNRALAEFGLFFPVDPGANASIGGMCATNASGTTTIRYGSVRGNVRSLEVVVGDGSLIRAGVKARKSSAGYDLVNLFVGSEGTLGVITEITLRLYPIPEQTVSARAVFRDVSSACRAVVGLVGAGVAVSRAELLDGPTLALINEYQGTRYSERPTLFIEIAGASSAVPKELDECRAACTGEGAIEFEVEIDPTAQARLWKARHEFAHALIPRHRRKAIVGTDICVPISELPGAVAHAREEVEKRGIDAVLVAHAGDGNYHLACMIDREDPKDSEEFNALYETLVDYAIVRGGTCSGEHGIGIRKIPFLERQHPDLIPWMRAIKALFDPQGIMNPGKVLAQPGLCPDQLPSAEPGVEP